MVGLLVLGAGSRARLGWPFYSAAGLFGCLALLSAISSLWSGSVELSVIEADRVLVYLAFFLAAFLIAQTAERRQRFAEGIAIAVAIAVLLGLASRLLPHVLEVAEGLGSGPRLRYPLGYWNANGAMCGIAVPMLLWMSRNARWTALRWASVAVLPAIGVTLYFTYSRGGLLALAVGALCILALSRDRLWMLATLVIAAIGALPALLSIPATTASPTTSPLRHPSTRASRCCSSCSPGRRPPSSSSPCCGGWRRRGGGRTRARARAVPRSASAEGTGAALGVLVVVAAIVFGGRAWDQFSSSDIEFPADPAQHFSDLSSAGRHDFWRVAIDAFEEKPLPGHGAGTYEFSWDKLRTIKLAVLDAHSLYLEAFAELGLLGGLLVLALFGSILWVGIGAWRPLPSPSARPMRPSSRRC